MKKIIIIASGILFFILLIIFIISRPKPNQNNNLVIPTPTTIPIAFQLKKQLIEKSLSYVPYEDEDFRFDYNPETNQFIVQEKTDIGQEKFIEWAEQNQINELAANPELIIFQDQENNYLSPKPLSDKNNQLTDPNLFIEFLNIFFNLGRGSEQTNNSQSSLSLSNSSLSSINQSLSTNNQSLTYFAQCDSEYAEIPLPDGCNMCQAGCGAATVAMIASSYLGKEYNPQNIVNQYKNKGYLLSCAGSRYSDARSLLQSLGLKTTDYIIFDYETADQVVNDLKKYLKAGWTFFTLANFKENGGGHFFWITDIDEKDNILAYDPYYGRFEAPPINENSRYPFPKYRLAFGVKK